MMDEKFINGFNEISLSELDTITDFIKKTKKIIDEAKDEDKRKQLERIDSLKDLGDDWVLDNGGELFDDYFLDDVKYILNACDSGLEIFPLRDSGIQFEFDALYYDVEVSIWKNNKNGYNVSMYLRIYKKDDIEKKFSFDNIYACACLINFLMHLENLYLEGWGSNND